MNSKIAKVSAILTLATAALLVGYMILFRFMPYTLDEGGLGVALFIFILFSYIGVIIYSSSSIFALVALIFGIKMLRAQESDRQISLNKRMLIAACVLLPFVAVSLAYDIMLLYMKGVSAIAGIYAMVTAVVYIACIVTYIAAIVVIKKSSL